MLTFGITTTTKCASLSLHNDDKLLGEITIEVVKTHSTTIIQQIEKLFEWCSKELNDVDNVIVSIGPGSFTGVRIAIAVVKGIFYGKNVNIYSVNELDALANKCLSLNKENAKRNDILYSIIDSGKEKIYYSKYEIVNCKNLQITQFEKYPLVSKLDNFLDDIRNESNNIFLIGDAIINYRKKIEEFLQSSNLTNIKILDDKDLKISSNIYYYMMKKNVLTREDIFTLKPNYLEKSQAERDKLLK